MFKYAMLLLLSAFSCTSLGQTVRKEISLCGIEKNPELYIGKQLDVEAIYISGFEMGWLEDSNSCENQPGKHHAILYKFDDNYKKESDAKALRRFSKLTKRKLKKSGDVRKVQGQFRIQLSKYSKKNEHDTRYDYEITVLKIISVISANK
jgi:hypothetical protein